MGFDLDAALNEALDLGASDLHLKVPSPPHVRIEGELVPLNGRPPFSLADADEVRARVLTSHIKREDFERRGASDLSYFTDRCRFRVAAFTQRGAASFVFRTIPEAPTGAGLTIPDAVLEWSSLQRGLVVIAGPTGMGKSTTSATLIDRINRSRRAHIITIEDPIEFLHRDRTSLISQREVGIDAPTHAEALRSALRQDPDVIVVGEVRDEDTAVSAVRAAETGHLVLCTMHTPNAADTIERFLDLVGNRGDALGRRVLASTLAGICAQRLVPGADGKRRLCTEVVVATARVHDLIVGGPVNGELQDAIRDGSFYGMRTFDQDLERLVRDGEITEQDALGAATHPHDLRLSLAGTGSRV